MPGTIKGVCKRCPTSSTKSLTGRPPLLPPCKCDVCGKLGGIVLSPPHPGNDIIIRNKKWVRALSRRLKAQRERASELDTTRLMPKPSRKKPVKQKQKKSSLLDVLQLKRDCACELMASAIRADLHKNLGMSELRTAINRASFEKPKPQATEKNISK